VDNPPFFVMTSHPVLKQTASGNTGRKTILLSMSLVLLSFKLFMIHRYASQCPFWDQWDADWQGLYLQYLKGRLKYGMFFKLHNEHMILFTRIISLLILELMGRWDSVAGMVFNSFLHVVALSMFVHFATRSMSDMAFGVALFLFTPFLIIPVGWENLLWSIQSQVFFSFLFSVASLRLCITAPFPSKQWMAGLVLSLCAYSNTAYGALVFAVLFGFSLVRLLISEEDRRNGIVECLIHLALFLAIYARTPDYQHHAALKAQSLGQFIDACSVLLSWPFEKSLWYPIVLWMPTAALAVQLLAKGLPRSDKALPFLAISAWVLASDLALALGRANGLLPSRYLDTVSLGVLTNTGATLILLGRMPVGRLKTFFAIAATVFVCWIGHRMVDAAKSSMQGVGWRHQVGKRNEERIKGYILTGDTLLLFASVCCFSLLLIRYIRRILIFPR
jgi:hypothetical protein